MGIALFAAFVAFVACHGALVAGLARRSPRWRALAALVVAPLAPWWGFRAGMRRRAAGWVIAVALYALGVAVAAITGP